MTLSLTCPCGALLEIDDKFAGQTINCPDCNRPLSTAPPAPNPGLTSGLALASLLLALIGAFTVVGTCAAIVCGALALRQIRRAPEKWGGKRLAQGGIFLGIVFTILTFILLAYPGFVRLGGILRALEAAGTMEYSPEEEVSILSGGFDLPRSGSIKRPSPAWGRWIFNEKPEDLLLVNLWDDAYIICLTTWLEQQTGLTLEDCRQEAQRRFLQSELVTKFLGQTGSPSPVGQERENKKLPGNDTQEFLFDLRLRGTDWTFLIRVAREGTKLNIVAGGTRKNHFARLQPQIVQALDSYKLEK